MAASARPSVLRAEGLSLRIGGVTIVDDVSLDIREAEFVVVIGPNGAGKTTLFNLLSGVARPTAGRVVLRAHDITQAAPYARARLGLGRTFQTSTVFGGLSTFENVRLAAGAALGGSGSVWRLAGGAGPARERAHDVLALVGLGARAAALAASLSHGEKRKLDLAILLAASPDVVLLDEPTAGMALEDIPEVMALVERIHRHERKTVVMVEHRMDLVMGLADRIAVMHHGALLAFDTPERIVADEAVQAAYLGDQL